MDKPIVLDYYHALACAARQQGRPPHEVVSIDNTTSFFDFDMRCALALRLSEAAIYSKPSSVRVKGKILKA